MHKQAETIIDANYPDDLALLSNTPAEAESFLHSLKRTTGGIGPHVNANKIDYMCSKQKGTTSILRSKPLKLVNQFPYFGSNISSTEKNVKIHLVKAGDAIDRLSII